MFTRLTLFSFCTLTLIASGCGGDATPPPRTAASRATATPPARPGTARPTRPHARPAAARLLTPKWTIKTQGQHATIAGAHGKAVYLAAGDYLANGLPTRWVYALEVTQGKTLWLHSLTAPKMPVTVKVGTSAIELEGGDDTYWLTWAGKKQLRPPEVSAEQQPPTFTVGCNLQGKTISCRNMDDMKPLWSRTYANALAKERVISNDEVCFAEAKTLLLRCVNARTGKPLFAVQVPRISAVKDPDRPRFTYARVGDWLVVANYNNVVTGYTTVAPAK